MAEFAVAALTTIATTAAEVGTTVAATAGEIGTAVAGSAGAMGAPAIPGIFGTAGSLGGLSTVASILSGGATVASVLNAQRAGEAKADALNMQASDADMSARLEAVQGTDRRNSLKASLVQALGDRDVATAASGVDLSFGTPAVARQQALTDGERALATDADTQDFRVARLRERAASFRAQAIGANSAGLGTAAALALDGGSKLLRRG